MSDRVYIFLILGDLMSGFLIWLYLKDYFNHFGKWEAALIKSLVYPLFFGIGAIGEGGGDPGFMLPAPILPAAIVALIENSFYEFLLNALLPYCFWASLLFLFYALREAIRHRKSRIHKLKRAL